MSNGEYETEPWVDSDVNVNEQLRNVFLDNRDHILANSSISDAISLFNTPLIASPETDRRAWGLRLLTFIRDIGRSNQENALKINFQFGYILRHVETGDLRYFVPSTQMGYFDVPFAINNPNGWNELLSQLAADDIWDHVFGLREDTKWVVSFVTNVTASVYDLNYVMGGPAPPPDYVMSHRGIRPLYLRPSNSKPYDDNLCAFRALAAHRNVQQGLSYKHQLETKTHSLARTWHTPYLLFSDLPLFEEHFDIGVDIYSLTPDQCVVPQYLTTHRQGDHMVLDLSEGGHLSYVCKVGLYLTKYQCELCETNFELLHNLTQHKRSCAYQTRHTFPGGYYTLPLTIFEKLERVDVVVPESDRFYDFLVTFDCESALIPTEDTPDPEAKTIYLNTHVPVSISVASNVPDYVKPKFFCDENPENLVRHFVEYLEQISNVAYTKCTEKWHNAIDLLDAKIEQCQDRYEKKRLLGIKNEFDSYMKQLLVFGFNSGKYDLVLLRTHLLKELNAVGNDDNHAADDDDDENRDDNVNHEDPSFKLPELKRSNINVIKKDAGYMSIITPNFRFLDISHFLAPGYSLRIFYAAYDVHDESKGKSFFPYEKMTSYEYLKCTEFPSYDDFFSSLKNENVLEAECSGSKAEKRATGEKNYNDLKLLWDEKQMSCMRDLLEHYNNMDVEPMITAILRMKQFYQERHFDIFKISFSVPGIARYWLLKEAHENGIHIPLVAEADADLHHLYRSAVCGGPSIIFHRYAKVDTTFIRDDPNHPVKAIIGLDANALYPSTFNQCFPTGFYVRRFAPHFWARNTSKRHEDMFMWMNYLSRKHNIHIQHARNSQSEVKIGKYYVDGLSVENKTIFEFDSCYYHCDTCDICKQADSEIRQQRAIRTKERAEFIRKSGYQLVTITDHEFDALVESDKDLADFIHSKLPPFYRDFGGARAFTTESIIQYVKEGRVFGFLEVDIHIPEDKYEKFHEMSPLYCTVPVDPEHWGDHMLNIAREQSIDLKSRRLLVGGMKAEKILLASPLLEYYLSEGLVVTHIYQIIEYAAETPFKSFLTQVTEARRRGDLDPSKVIIGDTYKLLANSSYGSLLMSREKHKNIKYFVSPERVQLYQNKPNFHATERLADDLFEVKMSKRSITENLPVHLGVYILQLAKLHMLRFYYNVLDTYVDRRHFQLLSSDTDSLYFSLSEKSLDDVIKPDYRETYMKQIYHSCDDEYNDHADYWFPRECCERHKTFD